MPAETAKVKFRERHFPGLSAIDSRWHDARVLNPNWERRRKVMFKKGMLALTVVLGMSISAFAGDCNNENFYGTYTRVDAPTDVMGDGAVIHNIFIRSSSLRAARFINTGPASKTIRPPSEPARRTSVHGNAARTENWWSRIFSRVTLLSGRTPTSHTRTFPSQRTIERRFCSK